LAATAGVSTNTIAATVRRLRVRLRDLTPAEVTDTLGNPAEAEVELRALLR
jgi:hypothetical protein